MDQPLGMLDCKLSPLIARCMVGRGDTLLHPPPLAEVHEHGGGKDAGTITGEKLGHSICSEVVPEGVDQLRRRPSSTGRGGILGLLGAIRVHVAQHSLAVVKSSL